MIERKPDLLDRVIDYWNKFVDEAPIFVRVNMPAIISTLLSLSAWTYFIVIAYHEELKISLSQDYIFLIAPIVVYAVVSLLFLGLRYESFIKSSQTWLISNSLMLVSALYYPRVYNSTLDILGIELHTSLVFIPLVIIIYLTNLNLFSSKAQNSLLIKAQVFFYFFVGFSTVDVIVSEGVLTAEFKRSLLQEITSFESLIASTIYVVLAIFIALISIFNLKFSTISNFTKTFLVKLLLTIQIFFIVYISTVPYPGEIGYWHKTLLGFILWDFLHIPFSTAIKNDKDYKYSRRLTVNIFYHIFLFLLVLLYPIYF